MIAYMKRHESYVREMLQKDLSPQALTEIAAWHDRQIAWMQHERLVHLLVMLFVCLFFLASFAFAAAAFSLPSFALASILLVLSAAYIFHYYRLENGVQSWYALAGQIRSRISAA